MKKVLYTLAALSFVFVACNKQEIVPEEGSSQEGELTTVTIKASNGDADTKAAISDGLAFTWTAGDKIAVHTDARCFYKSEELATDGATADFTVSLSGNRNGYAVYPASVAKSYSATPTPTLILTLPSTYTLAQVSGDNTPLPMIADNTSAALSFCHVAGLLRLTITNIPTGANKIKLDFNGKKVSGDFTISSPIAGTSSINAAASETEGDDIIWITGITGTADLTVNIPLPTGATYSDLIVSAWDSEDKALRGQVVAFNTYTPSRAHGKKLSAALNLGAVSIASGKYAVFAPGNLQATVSNPGTSNDPLTRTIYTATSWAFAPNQYFYSTDRQLDGTNTICDHFSWIGSNVSGEDSGVQNSYGLICWIVNNSTVLNLCGNTTLYGNWADLPIGPYASGTWRLPIGGTGGAGEWAYLIGQRSSVTRYAKGRIGQDETYYNGLFIFPDVYTQPEGVAAIVNANKSDDTFANNTFSYDDWEKMEKAGAIFLSAYGCRWNANTYPGNRILDSGNYGSYWCSNALNKQYAFTIYFVYTGEQNFVSSDQYSKKGEGRCVRLVRDLN